MFSCLLIPKVVQHFINTFVRIVNLIVFTVIMIFNKWYLRAIKTFPI